MRVATSKAAAMIFVLLAMASGALRAASSKGGAAPEPSACRSEVVRPNHGPSANRFVAWLDVHPEATPGHEALRDILARGEQQAIVFIADIDNDGQDEYTLTTVEGSGAYLGLWVYRRSGDGFVQEALAAGPAAYDYTWLLEYKSRPNAQLVKDPRFNGLLSAAVPDVKFKDGESFRDVLKLHLTFPGVITFFGDRGVVLTGCVPHDCGEKAWVWVDLRRQRSIVVTTGGFYEATLEDPGFALALGSTTIPAAQVPPDFWTQIDETLVRASGGLDVKLSDAAGEDGIVVYAGPDGAWEKLAISRRNE